MDLSTERIIMMLCGIPALVAGLTFHEFAHAWAADRLGDPTPRREGRLTLDPVKHIDPIGALFYILSSLAGFGFGWAKPVMTNPRNLRHPHRDGMWIALAGPISNILQTPIWLIALFLFTFIARKMGINTDAGAAYLLGEVLFRGVVINLMLAAFNMVPIPPLDGHWVLGALAGEPVRELYNQIRPYSFMILIVLLNFPQPSLFDYALAPVIRFSYMISLLAETLGYALAT